jgi:nitronate monooxygenase
MDLNDLKQQMKLPVMMAPMFLISNPNMVIRACATGIIGSFPALNARTTEMLDAWMTEINTAIAHLKKDQPNEKIAPWAVNFISHKSNKRFNADLALIEKHQPPVVITSLGDPSPVVRIVHQYGGLVFSDVINVKFAKKALEKGSDGLVLVASGAGGHGGTFNPFAFVHEIRNFFDGPLILSGTMSRGEDILAAEVLGADFAYFGTRFIAAAESGAADDYKAMTITSSIDDIVYTPAFSGIPANYLIPSIVKAGLDPKALPKNKKVDFSELGNPDIRAWKDIWGAG